MASQDKERRSSRTDSHPPGMKRDPTVVLKHQPDASGPIESQIERTIGYGSQLGGSTANWEGFSSRLTEIQLNKNDPEYKSKLETLKSEVEKAALSYCWWQMSRASDLSFASLNLNFVRMFFDTRVRKIGGRAPTAVIGKRDGQEILATSSASQTAAIDNGNLAEYCTLQGSALVPVSSLLSIDVPANSAQISGPTPSILPCTSSSSVMSSTTTQSTDTGSAMSRLTNTATELATTGDDDLQSAMPGSPSLSAQSSSTNTDDLHTAGVSDSWTALAAQNTWITTISDEDSSSGVTIVPLTFEGATSSAGSTTTVRHLPTTSTSRFSATDYSSSAFASVTSAASILPNLKHAEGTNPAMTTRTIAGVAAGAVVIIILIILCVFIYVRGGVLRGMNSNAQLSALRPSKKSAVVNESQENLYRRDMSEIRPRDLENATVTAGTHYDDTEEGWEKIDMHDARSGNMGKDNGEWLESWRRGKERMMTTRQAPELHFNPDLPLPPISWEETKK
ncbi:uncharacterized protein FOMMEDRAFT_31682 [Fomitiporia mediterranea MF3/22]|uniref:uncharacterized protein n=1 Tax=Fomitiporia mediterranea (strain MF3/22) TaxID=694068 RepID=UPI0004409AC3|nr:uncharacterized protein FOMMEDRAFT_31682 [Fomitiporia mediterranea MF3/22]EJC98653.1 hypothetical protein FOMMEDRAFT_31682 [Fomitiporia mediterranea MF3/22]